MQMRTQRVIGSILGCWVVLALVVGASGMRAEGEGEGEGEGTREARETKAAIPAEQVIASIRTAVAAKPGNVQAIELEKEGNNTLCEVEILAADGKTCEVEVDVATGTVVEVEVEDDDDEDDDANDRDNDDEDENDK